MPCCASCQTVPPGTQTGVERLVVREAVVTDRARCMARLQLYLVSRNTRGADTAPNLAGGICDQYPRQGSGGQRGGSCDDIGHPARDRRPHHQLGTLFRDAPGGFILRRPGDEVEITMRRTVLNRVYDRDRRYNWGHGSVIVLVACPPSPPAGMVGGQIRRSSNGWRLRCIVMPRSLIELPYRSLHYRRFRSLHYRPAGGDRQRPDACRLPLNRRWALIDLRSGEPLARRQRRDAVWPVDGRGTGGS